MEIGVGIVPESKELLDPSLAIECANSYGTRGRPYEIVVNGNMEIWHSLKGGKNPTKETPLDDINASYEVLWSPATKRWLKLVPPEVKNNLSNYQKLQDRLSLSSTIAKRALEVAGLPHLTDSISECSVEIRGEETSGFTSAHIGPSVQYLLERFSESNPIPGQEIDTDSFSEIYKIAFDEAAFLYLRYGYWMDDPNPGNIILRDEADGVHVVLIDFSNQAQTEMIDFGIPADKMLPEKYKEKMDKLLFKNVIRLHDKFAKQCANYGIPFAPDLDYYRENSYNIASEKPMAVAA